MRATSFIDNLQYNDHRPGAASDDERRPHGVLVRLLRRRLRLRLLLALV